MNSVGPDIGTLLVKNIAFVATTSTRKEFSLQLLECRVVALSECLAFPRLLIVTYKETKTRKYLSSL